LPLRHSRDKGVNIKGVRENMYDEYQTLKVKLKNPDTLYVDKDIDPKQVLFGPEILEVVVTPFVGGMIQRGELEVQMKDFIQLMREGKLQANEIPTQMLSQYVGIKIVRGVTREVLIEKAKEKMELERTTAPAMHEEVGPSMEDTKEG
jgi:hypothetical protein